MNFTSNDLMPSQSLVPIKRAWFSLPLTPFFIPAANSANARTRGFRGNDFYLQFKSNHCRPTDRARRALSLEFARP